MRFSWAGLMLGVVPKSRPPSGPRNPSARWGETEMDSPRESKPRCPCAGCKCSPYKCLESFLRLHPAVVTSKFTQANVSLRFFQMMLFDFFGMCSLHSARFDVRDIWIYLVVMKERERERYASESLFHSENLKTCLWVSTKSKL